MIETWFHGSSESQKILNQGFDIDAPRRSDVGDFGWGIYFSKTISRAKSYGKGILQVEVDVSEVAYIKNPYFLEGLTPLEPTTFEEQFFYSLAFDESGQMLTVNGNSLDRKRISKLIQQQFLSRHYTGISTDYSGGELVVFDPKIILIVQRSQ